MNSFQAKIFRLLQVRNMMVFSFFVLIISSAGLAGPSKPWLGLEHVNKASKRPRYNYLEKAIKIHN